MRKEGQELSLLMFTRNVPVARVGRDDVGWVCVLGQGSLYGPGF